MRILKRGLDYIKVLERRTINENTYGGNKQLAEGDRAMRRFKEAKEAGQVLHLHRTKGIVEVVDGVFINVFLETRGWLAASTSLVQSKMA
ncbi:unnamed protein product [Urochloa humidicola]